MDPTATLQILRNQAAGLRGRRRSAAVEIAQAFEDLDGWLSTGGFLPTPWATATAGPPGRPRAQQDGTVLTGVPHGRRVSYNAGCRCLACRAANRLKRNLDETEMENFDV